LLSNIKFSVPLYLKQSIICK